MKAARLHKYDPAVQGPEFLKLVAVPDPKIQDADDVIVRIGGAGLCRTDLHIIEGVGRSKVGVPLPYTPAHENAGRVDDTGGEVRHCTGCVAVTVDPPNAEAPWPSWR